MLTLLNVCVRQRTCCFPPFIPQHQGLVPNFVVISKIKDKQKHYRLLPLLQYKEVEQRRRATARGMKRGKEKHFEEGGGYLNTGLNKAVRNGVTEEKRWMKREWILRRRSPKTWIECMCLLSQLITLYRGHGLSLYTTHTRSSGRGWDVSSNCNSFWKSEWISFAFPRSSMACIAWCYPNSSGKECLA